MMFNTHYITIFNYVGLLILEEHLFIVTFSRPVFFNVIEYQALAEAASHL